MVIPVLPKWKESVIDAIENAFKDKCQGIHQWLTIEIEKCNTEKGAGKCWGTWASSLFVGRE